MKRTLRQTRDYVCKLCDKLLQSRAIIERLMQDLDTIVTKYPAVQDIYRDYLDKLDECEYNLNQMICDINNIYSQLGYFNLSIVLNMVNKSTVSTEISTNILSVEEGEHGQTYGD